MAFSATRTSRSVAGNVVKETWAWSAASVTTGSFSCGLGTIFHKSSNNDVTEDVGKLVHDGSLVTISGVTSNDTGTIEVTGH